MVYCVVCMWFSGQCQCAGVTFQSDGNLMLHLVHIRTHTLTAAKNLSRIDSSLLVLEKDAGLVWRPSISQLSLHYLDLLLQCCTFQMRILEALMHPLIPSCSIDPFLSSLYAVCKMRWWTQWGEHVLGISWQECDPTKISTGLISHIS